MSKVVDISGQEIEIIKKIKGKDTGAFVYLDPPYYPITKSINRLYNGDFTPADFLKLKLRCDELTKAGVLFVLSNSDCEFIRILFKDYPVVEIMEPRLIKAGKKRPPAKCLMITNFKQKKEFMKSIKTMNQLIGEKKNV